MVHSDNGRIVKINKSSGKAKISKIWPNCSSIPSVLLLKHDVFKWFAIACIRMNGRARVVHFIEQRIRISSKKYSCAWTCLCVCEIVVFCLVCSHCNNWCIRQCHAFGWLQCRQREIIELLLLMNRRALNHIRICWCRHRSHVYTTNLSLRVCLSRNISLGKQDFMGATDLNSVRVSLGFD